jgi:hypothetical protein
MALRNRDGGYLIIGLDNRTLAPVDEGKPADVRTAFHIDVIQQIVSKYASTPFEVAVAFAQREGQEFPVIAVGGGVNSPVAATKELTASDGKVLIKQHAVYFRTLNSSGVPSSSPARYSDWADVVNICFENREADIGRFLRRHLGVEGAASFKEMVGGTKALLGLRDRAASALDQNEQRLAAALAARGKGVLYSQMGWWSVLLRFDPPLPEDVSAADFFNTVASANPRYTGWPVWLDSRGAGDKEARPRLVDKTWETIIVDLDQSWGGAHADFHRIDRRGEFYLWRVLQDDLSSKIDPGKYLDPGLMIYRILETLAVGLSFAKALGRGEETTLSFAFRWKNLESRKLESWSDSRYISPHGTAMGNSAEGYIEIPADTPPDAIANYAQAATRDLFELWDGWQYPLRATEQQLERLLKRTL